MKAEEGGGEGDGEGGEGKGEEEAMGGGPASADELRLVLNSSYYTPLITLYTPSRHL